MNAGCDPASVRRLLVFRTGSIGDTVVALPCFHLLRRVFPDAERRVLTNFPVNSDAAPLHAVLGDAGFVHGWFRFTLGLRHPGRILALRREIARWAPDCAVYLRERRHAAQVLRDVAFLRWCGVKRVIGGGAAPDLTRHRGPDADGLWESEASRLARCLAGLGEARIDDPTSRDLLFSPDEIAAAERLLDAHHGRRFVAFAIGAKIDFKDWGDHNWRRVLDALTAAFPDHALMLIGGAGDGPRARAAASGWRGPVLDLCGRAAPRLSALALRRATALLCHDSGPMHLAASVGTPVVAVFSTHARPGVWFPFGTRHRIFYPGLAWSGGAPPKTRDAAGEYNITQIPPAQVAAAARDLIARAAG